MRERERESGKSMLAAWLDDDDDDDVKKEYNDYINPFANRKSNRIIILPGKGLINVLLIEDHRKIVVSSAVFASILFRENAGESLI